ncbi:12193_t:CDS:1, partial [Dentiscutata heterogama]
MSATLIYYCREECVPHRDRGVNSHFTRTYVEKVVAEIWAILKITNYTEYNIRP